jgi:hypothetical protein
MATAAQITANRANSQLSTGPVSLEGKTRIAQNARKHGLTAQHLVIRDDEREDFEALRDSLLAELSPQGAVETVTFEELLHAAWNLHRFRTIESEVSLGTIDDFTDPQTTAVLDRLSRYQARAQRAYYRALQELRTLQTNRALRAVKLAAEDEAAIPAITDINELTKQTRSEVTAQALDMALKMVNYQAETFKLQSFQSRVAPTVEPTAAA